MLIFNFRHAGRQHCRYVSAELAPLLRHALENGRKLEKRLAELGLELLQRYRRQRG
jgi:hypothetical protein